MTVYVCLCHAVTSTTVQELIDRGVHSTKEIGKQCKAGTECGRCKQTMRLMIAKKTGRYGR